MSIDLTARFVSPPRPRPVRSRLYPLIVALIMGLALAWPRSAYADNIAVTGGCSLPDAIAAANTDMSVGGCTAGNGDDTLLLDSTTYSLATGPYDHDGLTATPSVTTTIIISGGIGGATIERSGGTQYRLLHVGTTGNLTVEHVTLRNGSLPSRSGGAIYNRGLLTLMESILISNTASTGGSIYNDSASLTLIGTTITANTATNGSGLYNLNATATLTDTTFISNTATFAGGGIYNNGGASSIVASHFISNTASNSGGGIFNTSTNPTISDSTFVANTAQNGGSLYNNSTVLTLTHTSFTANTAQNGGGINNSSTTATLTDTTFISNTASQFGGGILNLNGASTIAASDFISNTASNSGGGIFNSSSTSTIASTTFTANAADRGGGIYNISSSSTVATSDFISNTASSGGGIYNDSATSAITDTTFTANTANLGGGLGQEDGQTTLFQARFLNNAASDTGGALQVSSGNLSLDQSCIVYNTDIAVNNTGSTTIDADNNWWGANDGPSGIGLGAGDSVSGTVTFSPFLTSPILGCPTSNIQAAIAVEKVANPTTAQVGDTITYTYRVTNTGNITLSTITAEDDQLGTVSGLAGQLQVGESRVATLTHVVTAGDLPGPLVNTVIVTATDSLDNVVTGNASAAVNVSSPTNLPPGEQPVQSGLEMYLPSIETE